MFVNASGAFDVFGSATSVTVSVRDTVDIFSSSWSVRFSVPGGLQPGTYEAAAGGGQPSISVSGNGRACGRNTGRFTVRDFLPPTAAQANATINRIHVSFEHQCDGGATLPGEVWFVR